MRHEVRNSKLRAIYEQVPDFDCAEECDSECCGELITHVAIEWSQIVRYLQRNGRPVPKRKMTRKQREMKAFLVGTVLDADVGGTEHKCSLLKDGRCSVYPVRPLVCRLFGFGLKGYLLCPKVEPPKDGFPEEKIDGLMRELTELNIVFVDRRERRRKKK